MSLKLRVRSNYRSNRSKMWGKIPSRVKSYLDKTYKKQLPPANLTSNS